MSKNPNDFDWKEVGRVYKGTPKSGGDDNPMVGIIVIIVIVLLIAACMG